ncbi:UNVERIFIED_CONTAM: hypothetical protein PYX00_000419 [Menopon gallinae]|uniref:Uncharacterized protein n=1 Tax=Menopon gallinae TaxID=328185 RepID=A0AAW2IB45_9NEOP
MVRPRLEATPYTFGKPRPVGATPWPSAAMVAQEDDGVSRVPPVNPGQSAVDREGQAKRKSPVASLTAT